MKKLLLLLFLTVPGSLALAQSDADISVLFESEPGLSLGALLDSATVSFQDRADINLDGRADLTLLGVDAQGDPFEIVTLDVASLDTLWRISYQEVGAVMGTRNFRFVGFFTFDLGGSRQAVFRSREALGIIGVLVGKRGGAAPRVVPTRRFALLDITGDGAVELIAQNDQRETVQVWGTATTTATEDDLRAALAPLLESYPNPFQHRATVAYEVPKAGPVTLTIFDLLGRRVRTLVDEVLPLGAYRTVWDGRDAAGQAVSSGTYFYRLRVGDAVRSKATIRLR